LIHCRLFDATEIASLISTVAFRAELKRGLIVQLFNHAEEFEMKKIFLLSILSLTIAVTVVVASYTRASQNRDAASLTGVWKGSFPEAPAVPAVEITLNIQAGQLAGKAVFYKVVVSAAGGEIKGKAEAPILDPVIDGKFLSFKVKRDDGSFFKGRIEFVAEHKAVLRSNDRDTGDELAITLRREK
jgi:hypothetical protein